MPKQKTRKAIAKRVKITARGKVLRRHPGVGHLRSTKSSKLKRHQRKDVPVYKAFAEQAKKLLPGPR